MESGRYKVARRFLINSKERQERAPHRASAWEWLRALEVERWQERHRVGWNACQRMGSGGRKEKSHKEGVNNLKTEASLHKKSCGTSPRKRMLEDGDWKAI